MGNMLNINILYLFVFNPYICTVIAAVNDMEEIVKAVQPSLREYAIFSRYAPPLIYFPIPIRHTVQQYTRIAEFL